MIYRAVIVSMGILLAYSNIYSETPDTGKHYPLALMPYPGPGKIGGSNEEVITFLDNIRINSDQSGELQNEEMVCISPLDPDVAIAVWRDFRLGYRRIGVGRTTDGGQTWSDELVTPYPPYERQSDPVLWVDRDGVFYLSTLDLPSGDGPSGIAVYRSTDDGLTWSDPTWAVTGQTDYFEDKQWFGMDQTGGPGDGKIYCVWDRFASDYSATGIVSVVSTDGGLTFSEPVNVSDYGISYVQWPTVTCDPQSNVYVAWYDHRSLARITMAISNDFGQTFSAPFPVVYLESAFGDLNGDITVFPYPAMACDINPQSDHYGRIYIIYANGYDDWDIWCVYSDDGAESWSERVRVNDDPFDNGCDQFHPWLSIDEAGVIHVCFLDRRDDAGNMLYNLYYTRSTDGGETWEENHRISTASSDPAFAALAGLLGEYIGISASQGDVQMVWTDIRNLNQDAYSARIRASFLAGDVNNNHDVLNSDIDCLVGYFRGLNGVPDPPIWRADANGDCLIDAADVTYLVAYFRGTGPAPVDGNCN